MLCDLDCEAHVNVVTMRQVTFFLQLCLSLLCLQIFTLPQARAETEVSPARRDLFAVSPARRDFSKQSNFVRYHHLSAGQYTFEVQVKHEAEGDFGPLRTSKILVKSSPWLHPIALTSYGVIGLLMLSGILYPMIARIREREAAARKIRASEKRVRVLLSNTGCELWHFHIAERTLEREGVLSNLPESGEAVRVPVEYTISNMHEADRKGFVEKMRAHIAGESSMFEHVYRMKSRSGEYVWLRSLGAVEERDSAQIPTIVSGTTVDISDFKSKESELATANDALNQQVTALELARAHLSDLEKRRKLALWGAGCEFFEAFLVTQKLIRENAIENLMANDRADDLKAYWQYLHPGDLARFTEAFLKHVKGLADFYDVTYRTKRIDGSWCWVQTRGRAVAWDEKGHATIIAGTNYDVSELKLAELALQEATDVLEHRVIERTKDLSNALDELRAAQTQLVTQEKMAALGGLVAGVAHEINTPLGISVTAASHLSEIAQRMRNQVESGQLRKSDLLDYAEQSSAAAELVSINLRRASELVRSFKQVAVDQSTEECRVIEVKSYLEDVLTSLRPNTKRFRHVITLSSEVLHIKSYPGAIYQLISNLVLNALLHAFAEPPFPSDQVGNITITAHSEDGELHLCVADDGIGMSEEIRKKVFEPFFTTKRGQGGSGLGLHIVFNLVAKVFKGQIFLHSELGKGSRFEIRIPFENGN
jgi:signal transduction histidine kinase